MVQSILTYIILAFAVFYILKKFILPKRLFSSGKSAAKGCGEDNCGCH